MTGVQTCALPISKSNEEHEEHLRLTLTKLREHRLYAKFSMCEFWISEVVYLGHVISAKGIAVNPETVKSIAEWLPPINVKQVRSFLGLASYCRRFVERGLEEAILLQQGLHLQRLRHGPLPGNPRERDIGGCSPGGSPNLRPMLWLEGRPCIVQIGRASCRERVLRLV